MYKFSFLLQNLQQKICFPWIIVEVRHCIKNVQVIQDRPPVEQGISEIAIVECSTKKHLFLYIKESSTISVINCKQSLLSDKAKFQKINISVNLTNICTQIVNFVQNCKLCLFYTVFRLEQKKKLPFSLCHSTQFSFPFAVYCNETNIFVTFVHRLKCEREREKQTDRQIKRQTEKDRERDSRPFVGGKTNGSSPFAHKLHLSRT